MKTTHDYEKALARFESLLDTEKSLEADWQLLFAEHPFILTDCLPLGIEPEALVSCKPGRAEADFYFYPSDPDIGMSPYGVIEIKRPDTKLLKRPRKDVICLSADATAAVAQAQKYALELGAQVERTSSGLVVLGNTFHTFVIAGLSTEIARKVTNQMLREQAERLLPASCRLVPFDTLAKELKRRTPPRFHVLLPVLPTPKPLGTSPVVPTPVLPVAERSRSDRHTPFKPRGGFFGGPREMFETVCTACSHTTFVPFKPIEGRPTFCRDCYMRHKDQRS